MSDKVLFVDDDPNLLASYQRQLRKQFTIETASNGAQGLEAVTQHGSYAVIVSDFRMSGIDGIEFFCRVREKAPDSVRMMLTGYADVKTAIEAVNEGNIFRFLTKPCHPDALFKALLAAVVATEAEYLVRSVNLQELEVNMILAEDVKTVRGILLIAKGHEVSRPLLERLTNIAKTSGIQEPI